MEKEGSTDNETVTAAPPLYYKAWREARGMTQDQVQALFGWSAGRLSKLESGKITMPAPTLSMLARVYGCDIGDLSRPPPPLLEVPPAGSDLGPGFAGFAEMQRVVDRLQREIAELRRTVVPRLDAIDGQLTEASKISRRAVKNAVELAELFARYASRAPREKG